MLSVNKYKFTNYSIIIIFIAFIFSSLIVFISTKDKKQSAFEKRNLKTFSSIQFTSKNIFSLPLQFEKYFNDQFGFRDFYVRTNSLFYVYFWRKAPNSLVTVGNDGWLFYNGNNVLNDFLGLRKYTIGELEYCRRTIEDRREWMADHNILYLVAIAPSKMMIYPEKLPHPIRQRQGASFIDQFFGYLERFSIRDYIIDSRPALLSKKSTEQVYFRTDSHWNNYGGYIAYREIIRRMAQWTDPVKPLNKKALTRGAVRHAGDISYLMHLRDVLDEQIVTYSVNQPCASKDYGKLTSFLHPLKKYRNNSRYLPMYNGCTQKKGKILILHDSFGRFLRQYFNETFNTVIYSKFADFNHLDNFIIKISPDVVIDIRATRNLLRSLQHNPALEKRMLRKHFESSNTILFDIKNINTVNNFIEVHDALLSGNNDEILIHSTGNDPFVVYNFDSPQKNDVLFVHIIMTSPVDTILQLFFTTRDNEPFNEKSKITKKVKEGRNEFLFRLPYPDIQGKVRLDPGRDKGIFILHSFSIHKEIWEPKTF